MRVRGSTSVNTEVMGAGKTTVLHLFSGCACVVHRTDKPKAWGCVLAELRVMTPLGLQSLFPIRQLNQGLPWEEGFM